MWHPDCSSLSRWQVGRGGWGVGVPEKGRVGPGGAHERRATRGRGISPGAGAGAGIGSAAGLGKGGARRQHHRCWLQSGLPESQRGFPNQCPRV